MISLIVPIWNEEKNIIPFLNAVKENLISQLTSPVKWTHSINQMVEDGAKEFIEVGPGRVLQGLVRKINGDINSSSLNLENVG